jgi:hypothetical protein
VDPIILCMVKFLLMRGTGTINVYSIDNVLVGSFSSQVDVAEWLGIKSYTVSR